MDSASPPRLLTIAGSDSGGGAGLQADLKTFQALGCYGMSVVTALTAQNTKLIKSVYPVTPAFVEDQISAVFDDIGVDAVKIGMLHSEPIIAAVARLLKIYEAKNVVLDPVMVAKSEDRLLELDSVQALAELLFPLISVLTPNIPEAEMITGTKISQKRDMKEVADQLLRNVPCVVIKGGHFADSRSCPDLFASRSESFRWIELPRIATKNTHGTGCTYSAAIAAFLGKGMCLGDAVFKARKYLQAAVISGARFQIGQGNGPVDHNVC